MSFYLLQNEQDAQDVLQETLIRYMQKAPHFQTCEHEKAWILKVANNLCKDMLRFRKRNQYVNLDALSEIMEAPGSLKEEELVVKVFSLKEKYKQVIYLHYYECLSVKEIAAILGISEEAVKKRLERGRLMLKQILDAERAWC
jgi:RNA polymerase sigma-70 factor (ECF subfamily)